MRALLIVIDSFGVGAAADAAQYGDAGANTAQHICEGVRGAAWPQLKALGLGNCAALLGHTLPGCEPAPSPMASYGVMAEVSGGKDTTTGHWELAGILLEEPFTTFPLSFPSFPVPLIAAFEERSGYRVLGNKGASGTAIIDELGPAHLAGEGLIVYTSADSVFQIAAHEGVVPIEELYRLCGIARELCDPYRIGRVIARPFIGTPGSFSRTSGRRDFSMLPLEPTILDRLLQGGVQTVAIGKIGDIFSERGIARSYHDSGNEACRARLLACLDEQVSGDQFLFVNLVDTDMHYGHRRDIQGYHDEVARIDAWLPEVMARLGEDDLMLISADHGCDPGFAGSDHTREYVPLLAFRRSQPPAPLGIRQGFYDVAQSLAAFFAIPSMVRGVTFIE